MKRILVLSLLILTGLNAYSQDESKVQEQQPIIDMHMHTGLPHKVPAGTPSLCRPEPCEGHVPATVDPIALMEKTLKLMDHYNIVKGFISGVDLTAVQKWKMAAPERFIAAPFILKPGSPDPRESQKGVPFG